MRNILRLKFGSHLYGTSTPASDLDFKSIYIPPARDIVLQRAKGVFNDQRPKAEKEKNYAGEVEEERFSLQRYLQLLAEGQTVAIDTLFAPDWAHTEAPDPVWREIQDNKEKLLTKRSAAFIGYARQQANKYGIKGSRVSAARKALDLLQQGVDHYGTTEKLSALSGQIMAMVVDNEHMGINKDTTPHGQEVLLWEVCNRQMPFTASIKNARDIMQRIVDEYGKRALQAESQQGVDWKALSHAVRVGNEAVELLTTGHVTFPRPEATELIAIKVGDRVYQDVAEQIENLLVAVEKAAEGSTLRDAPDQEWIDDLVYNEYAKEIQSS